VLVKEIIRVIGISRGVTGSGGFTTAIPEEKIIIDSREKRSEYFE
jgi:hypothetical protein